MVKQTPKISEVILQAEKKKKKQALRPLFAVLKILGGLAVLWMLHIMFSKVLGHPWLGNGIIIVLVCIFLPLYLKAKWLFGDE